MKRTTIRLAVATLALTLMTPLAQAGRPDVPGRSEDKPDRGLRSQRDACAFVEGNAFTEAVSDNVFAGTIDDLELHGVLLSAWVTQTLADVRITGDGAIKATATTVYEIDGNNDGVCDEGEVCFETADRVRVSSPDGEDAEEDEEGGDLFDDVELPKINAQSLVSGGNGDFASACGRLALHGEVDFSADLTTSNWRVKGRLCSCD